MCQLRKKKREKKRESIISTALVTSRSSLDQTWMRTTFLQGESMAQGTQLAPDQMKIIRANIQIPTCGAHSKNGAS